MSARIEKSRWCISDNFVKTAKKFLFKYKFRDSDPFEVISPISYQWNVQNLHSGEKQKGTPKQMNNRPRWSKFHETWECTINKLHNFKLVSEKLHEWIIILCLLTKWSYNVSKEPSALHVIYNFFWCTESKGGFGNVLFYKTLLIMVDITVWNIAICQTAVA